MLKLWFHSYCEGDDLFPESCQLMGDHWFNLSAPWRTHSIGGRAMRSDGIFRST